MSTYKLIYFNFRGRAELIRLIFAYAGVKYEEQLITFEEWKTLKPTFTFEGLPVLEITENGKTVRLAQSISIARYLAEKFGIAGKNDLERAQCNMLLDHIYSDMNIKSVGGVLAIKNMDEKKSAWASLLNETLPHQLKLVQNILQANSSKKGFLVGDELTWADLALINFYDWLRQSKTNILAKLPALKEHDEKIRSISSVAEQQKRNSHVPLTAFALPEE